MTSIMTENEIFNRVQHVVIETLNVPAAKVTREAAFRTDLGADSLDLVSLITELEDTFDHKMNDDDAMVLQTVGDAVKFVQETLSSPAN